MKSLLVYIPGDTVIHRLNPCTKILLPLLLCIACFLTDAWWFLLGVLVLDIGIGFLAGIPGHTLKLLRGLGKLALFLLVMQVLFIQSGRVLATLPLGILITDHGLQVAVMGVLRLIDITLPLALMIAVTQMSDLANALVYHAHMPYKYAFAITSAIRFIPVFTGDMQMIMEAQTARGVAFDTKSFWKKLRLMIPLCVPLLISSVKKIESAAIAVELRGFSLRTRRSAYRRTSFDGRDLTAILAGLVLIALSVVF